MVPRSDFEPARGFFTHRGAPGGTFTALHAPPPATLPLIPSPVTRPEKRRVTGLPFTRSVRVNSIRSPHQSSAYSPKPGEALEALPQLQISVPGIYRSGPRGARARAPARPQVSRRAGAECGQHSAGRAYRRWSGGWQGGRTILPSVESGC